MPDSITDIVNRKFNDMIPTWDVAVVDEIFHEDVVAHDPTEPEPLRGRQAYRAAVIEVGGAFSEPQIRIEDQVTADDRVVTRWSFTARHDGEMYGIPATGRHVRFTGIRNRGLVTAWLSFVGFFVMLWCYWGVNLLLAGLHSYA
jgi:predicted ester cyclase